MSRLSSQSGHRYRLGDVDGSALFRSSELRHNLIFSRGPNYTVMWLCGFLYEDL